MNMFDSTLRKRDGERETLGERDDNDKLSDDLGKGPKSYESRSLTLSFASSLSSGIDDT